MRILLLPVTTQRSIIYCQQVALPRLRNKLRLDERVAARAGKIWSGFEHSDKKWKQTVVRWTGRLLDTVPFEENGLKTIPPRNTYMRKLKSSHSHISEKEAVKKDITDKLESIELLYPNNVQNSHDFAGAQNIIQSSVTKALQTHRKQAAWCFLGLPLTIPFAINPFIPNFPGIYLVYRIWSNWRALQAARHLKFLMEENQLKGCTSPELNSVYEKHPIGKSLKPELASALNDVFKDEHLYRELQQAVRQTRPRDQRENKEKKA